jgi:hypothetical protein
VIDHLPTRARCDRWLHFSDTTPRPFRGRWSPAQIPHSSSSSSGSPYSSVWYGLDSAAPADSGCAAKIGLVFMAAGNAGAGDSARAEAAVAAALSNGEAAAAAAAATALHSSLWPACQAAFRHALPLLQNHVARHPPQRKSFPVAPHQPHAWAASGASSDIS